MFGEPCLVPEELILAAGWELLFVEEDLADWKYQVS